MLISPTDAPSVRPKPNYLHCPLCYPASKEPLKGPHITQPFLNILYLGFTEQFWLSSVREWEALCSPSTSRLLIVSSSTLPPTWWPPCPTSRRFRPWPTLKSPWSPSNCLPLFSSPVCWIFTTPCSHSASVMPRKQSDDFTIRLGVGQLVTIDRWSRRSPETMLSRWMPWTRLTVCIPL